MLTQPYIQMFKVNRGWYITVGCQVLVFTHNEKSEMVQAFSDLILLGQSEAQNKWCDKGNDSGRPMRDYDVDPGAIRTEPLILSAAIGT